MSSLSLLSIFFFILTVINCIIFLACVIFFLFVYKRRGEHFTNKEKINYNLCVAYIIYGITSLYPTLNIFAAAGNNYTYLISYALYGVCCGVLITIYYFYVYMFSLSLKSSEEQKTNLCVFIYFWSRGRNYGCFYIIYSSTNYTKLV